MSRYLKPGPAFPLAEGVEVQAKRSTKLGRWENATVVEALPGELPMLRFRDGALVPVKPSRIRSRDPKLDPKAKRSAPALMGATFKAVFVDDATLVVGADFATPASSAGLNIKTRPKSAPLRSAKYLAYVRGLPCCVCAAPPPSDPHHFGRRGIGQKTDDLRTVPLCRFHHDEFHARGWIPELCRDVQYAQLDSSVRRALTERALFRTQVDLLVEYAKRAVG